MSRTNHYVQAYHLVNTSTIQREHPCKQFHCGSKKSLLGEDLEITEAVTRLQEAAKNFIGTYYHGRNMTIVAQGPLSLDHLQEILASNFAAIPAKPAVEPPPPACILPHDPDLFNRLYTIWPPRSDDHQVNLNSFTQIQRYCIAFCHS